MKLLKPKWVSHGGNPIYSLSIHPDGTRLATGGQGDDTGIVILWNMEPIRSETAERDPNTPKMLCELTNHLGCVNCVKWSNDGKWLASSGDDAIIMLWSLRSKGISAPVFGSKNPCHEQWGCGFMLRGHSGDVLDISWSHEDRYLASASVDNSVIIWNAMKFPEQIACLTSHTGLVKGLTWDPVGKYLASQSDDKSVRVWRTSDWKEETIVTQPFENCGGTTQMLRLSWSPDGRFIVSAHSLNNDGPTAHIIERNSWKTGMDFVGHRKSIEVVSFNPHLFMVPSGDSNHGCVAIGSRDRSISVWLTTRKRPLVVVHELFSNSVLDLAWSRDGYTLMGCSLDGSCAYLSFTKEELGVELNSDDINDMFLDLYGMKRFTTGKGSIDLLVEDPALLMKRDTTVVIKETTPTVNSIQETSFQKQVETRTKDGRRRITPITLSIDPGYEEMFTSPQSKDPSTPQRNQSLLSSVVDKQDKVVKSPSKPISFAPLSSPQSKTKTLSAAKAIISTGTKRPNANECENIKQKRVKKAKDGPGAVGGSASSKQSEKQQYFPKPVTQPCLTTTVSITSTVEVTNSSNGGSTVSCLQNGGPIWNASFASTAIVILSANDHVICLGFEDCSVLLVSTLTGRRLFPPIVMSCSPHSIVVLSHFVGIAMVNATYTVYDTSTFTSVVSSISFSHLFHDINDVAKLSLSDDGLPIVITDKQVYYYHKDMKSWVDIINADNECSMIRSSRFALSSTVTELTPLRSLQHAVGFSAFTSYANSSPSRNTTLAYLENQIGRSLALRSILEYHHWVKCYIRYVVSENMEDRLREVMASLSSHEYSTSMFIQECLTIITSNTKLQRLYCELRDNVQL